MAHQFRPQQNAVQLAARDEVHEANGKTGMFWLTGEVRHWTIPIPGGSVSIQSPVVRLWLPQTNDFAVVAFGDRGQMLGHTRGSVKGSLDELRKQIER